MIVSDGHGSLQPSCMFTCHLLKTRHARGWAVQGSSVQMTQEKLLRQHGILWRHLNIEIVRSPRLLVHVKVLRALSS